MPVNLKYNLVYRIFWYNIKRLTKNVVNTIGSSKTSSEEKWRPVA